MDPPTKKYRDPAFLNKVDYLTQKIRDRKPGCESIIPKGKACGRNLNKDCREETRSCDKLVKLYKPVCSAIQPYVTLAYRDFKSKGKELEQKLLNLSYDQLEEILEQARFCTQMRRFHRNECVVFKCRDWGHDTEITILEFLEQEIINLQNKILEKQRSDLFERLERGEITTNKYTELSTIIPPNKTFEVTELPPPEPVTESTAIIPPEPVTKSTEIIIPPMVNVTKAEYWLGQFIKRNPFMNMTVDYFEDEIRVVMHDSQHGTKYTGYGPLVLDSKNNPDPVMAYRSLYRDIIMKHGSEAQKLATRSWYTNPSRFAVKLLNPGLKDPVYRASFVDLLSYYGFGPTPELALEDLITHIKLELPV